MPPPLELTLILAATRDMGIGLNGTLPWTGLKKEMAYFARVTKRLPPNVHPPALNAVIMGRKTWDSIPARFRPLKGRLNVVVSRGGPASPAPAPSPPTDPDAEPVRAGSLGQAVRFLARERDAGRVGRVFVVGGAQVYGAALEMGGEAAAVARRVLLTRVEGEWECDTFFGLGLEEGGGERGWVRRGKAELDVWTGEEVPAGVQVEGGTEYEFQMWERVD